MTKTGAPTNEAEITERRKAALSDWDAIVRAFYVLFDGLGKIEQHETCIAFESIAPDVATSLTLRRDGLLAASMPLHGMQAKVTTLHWDSSMTWVELAGEGLSYTYRIPAELLRHRFSM